MRVVLIHGVDASGACTCGRGDGCPERTRGKHPILREWTKSATDDEQALRDQFARLRFDPNLGIALGVQSSGLYLVSIDDDDAARMAELEEQYGELPHTRSGQSPRGAHLVFALASDTPLDRIKNITGIGGSPGVDMKAAGGQVVIIGRNAGGEYSGFDVSVAVAELPAAWTLAILAPIKLPKSAGTYTPSTLREDAKAKRRHEVYLDSAIASECRMVSRTGEGQRNTAVHTAACRLIPLASGLHLPRGVAHVREEVVSAGVASGLSESEARATVASAERWATEQGLVRVPREVDAEAPPSRHLTVVRDDTPESTPPVELIEDNGQPAKVAENGVRMLAIHGRGRPRLNLLTNRVEWPDGSRVSDADEIRIQGWLVAQPSSHRVRIGIEAVHAAVLAYAEANPFHPVRDYLGGLVWDGVARLETFARDCLGAADSELVRGYMRCFMIGAVARAMVPGCQFDTVLVLEGPQGARKTSALRALFGAQWFGNTPINVKKSPDCYQALDGFWGYEFGEVDAFSKTEAGAVKGFISIREDTYRPSYGRNTVVRPRQVAFCATTNADTYLSDESGARRFQPVLCGTVDLARIGADRDQLWAEAVHRYAAGEPWHLGDALAELAADDVDGRYQGDSWEALLPSLLSDHASVTSAAALLLIGVEPGRQGRGDEMRVGAALRRMGWKRRRFERGGVRSYEYVRSPTQGRPMR
jgi:hypothetical protein